MCLYRYRVELILNYSSDARYKEKYEYYYNDFEIEDNNLKIKIKKNYDISIEILSCNKEEADLIADSCFRKICKVLTILIQLQNIKLDRIVPSLQYIPSLIEEDYKKNKNLDLNLKIPIKINSIKTRQELKLEQFNSIYDVFNNESILNIGDIIYFATLEPNIESRFFKLFSIIENIENMYSKSDNNLNINEKILNKNQANELIKIISKTINKFDLDEIYNKTLLDGLIQTIKSRTKFSRAKKLALIINKKFNIYNIDKYSINFAVDENKMKEFINIRNSLFHGGRNSSKLILLTNELQELCLKIFERDSHLIIDHK